MDGTEAWFGQINVPPRHRMIPPATTQGRAAPLALPVVLLAGGLATRMRPLTEKLPKSLLPVAGKPFLAHQLDLLQQQGIQQVVICAGHLGEKIRDEFPDGAAWGLRLDYSFDGPTLLGTGGAIRKALPLVGGSFFVLYGDSYLPVAWAPIAAAFARGEQPGLMTVYRNKGRYDASNVWFDAGVIKVYDKQKRRPEMQHIDYGLSLFRAAVFAEWPAGQPLDLAHVMQRLVQQGQLAGYEVRQRFYEIGSPAGLAELEGLLQSRGGPS